MSSNALVIGLIFSFNAILDVSVNVAAVTVPLEHVKLPAVILPVTVSDDNVPTDVIFGCAAVVTVAAVPLTDPLIVELTVNPVNVPTLVILGCAAVVTVPAVVALVAAPLNAPVNVVADTLPALILPVTLNDPNVPTLGCVLLLLLCIV